MKPGFFSLSRNYFSFLTTLLCVIALTGCAGSPDLESDVDSDVPGSFVSQNKSITPLDEPRKNEVIVVINNNAALGNHAGIFVGTRLSDPAGSYRNVRSHLTGWKRPSLNDYVDFQRVDGERIQTYRFALRESDLSAIAKRLPEADAALPLFCGSAVNNAIAGIGPFGSIKKVWWTTPAAVAEQLDSIIKNGPSVGQCVLPDGSSCSKPAHAQADVSQ